MAGDRGRALWEQRATRTSPVWGSIVRGLSLARELFLDWPQPRPCQWRVAGRRRSPLMEAAMEELEHNPLGLNRNWEVGDSQIRLDRRFHETHHIGCHHRGSLASVSRGHPGAPIVVDIRIRTMEAPD